MQNIKDMNVLVTGKLDVYLFKHNASLKFNLVALNLLSFLCMTGASHGVGAAIATAFAREGAKVHLVASPRSQEELRQCEANCKSMGSSKCECHVCDLSKGEDCANLCSKLGGADIDVLVNNAGVFGPSGEEQGPLKGNPDDWHEVIHTNLNAPMVLTRHLAPKMVEKGRGYIINIGDVEGSHSGPHHAVYAASKAGLRGFSMSCYESLRDKGVHVTLIEPGNIKGTKMMEETEKASGHQGAIEPDDVAQACLFAFRVSENCVPSEIVLKALKPNAS